MSQIISNTKKIFTNYMILLFHNLNWLEMLFFIMLPFIFRFVIEIIFLITHQGRSSSVVFDFLFPWAQDYREANWLMGIIDLIKSFIWSTVSLIPLYIKRRELIENGKVGLLSTGYIISKVILVFFCYYFIFYISVNGGKLGTCLYGGCK